MHPLCCPELLSPPGDLIFMARNRNACTVLVRTLFIMTLSAGLSACSGDSWFGDDVKPPVPGTRISVLEHERSLKHDPDLAASIRLPAPEDNAQWPQQGGYSHHAMQHMKVSASPKVAWIRSIGSGSGRRDRLMGEPVVANGTVYTIDTSGVVTALNAQSGATLWHKALAPDHEDDGYLMGGGVAFNNGRLFVTTGFADVIALKADKGEEIWRRSVPAPMRAGPTVSDGRVFVTTLDNKALALSEENGSIVWTYSGVEENTSVLGAAAPAVMGGVGIFPFTSGEVVALRTDTGAALWADSVVATRRTDATGTLAAIAARPVIDRTRIFVLGHSGLLTGIDMRTGERAWELSMAGLHQPWIAGDWLFAVTLDAEVVAIDARNGKIAWITSLDLWEDPEDRKGRITWAGPVLASDRLVLAGSHGKAVSINPYDGAVIGHLDMPAGISLSPAVAHEALYFLTDAGDVVCVR
ncbi:PQQ-binding-like beta-propeller repeat protein [Haematospirillum sp. 15-248]|nr:PQQ-binding-like beta-propeller repeat protein [Haematospirillum sp. 15-248]